MCIRDSNSGIKNEEKLEKENQAVSNPIESAVLGRTQYIEMFHHINSLFKDDKIWFVQIEPLFGGEPLKGTNKLGNDDIGSSFKPKTNKGKKKAQRTPDPNTITHIRIYGMFRESSTYVINFEDIMDNDPIIKDWFVFPENGVKEDRDLQEPDTGAYAGLVKWDLALKNPIYTHKAE